MHAQEPATGADPIGVSTPPSARPDRAHIDPYGLVLLDSDLDLLTRALGRVVTWPPLTNRPPAQAVHLARIRTHIFGGEPGGDIMAAISSFDAQRRAQGQKEVFGADFLFNATVQSVKEKRRRQQPSASRDPEAAAAVLHMWMGD